MQCPYKDGRKRERERKREGKVGGRKRENKVSNLKINRNFLQRSRTFIEDICAKPIFNIILNRGRQNAYPL